MESTARDVFWTRTNWFTVLMMASWGKKQKDCHLQALKSPRVLNFSATKTMESSSTNPKTIHGTDIFVCAPTFTHKKFNQVMYRWVNIQSSTWIYKICVTRCFFRWLGSALAVVPRDSLDSQVFNTGVHTMGKSCRVLEWAKLGRYSHLGRMVPYDGYVYVYKYN